MTTYTTERPRDLLILVARILLALLFVVFGWTKLIGYAGTVGYFTQIGLPVPEAAAAIAIVAEFFVALVIVVGIWTRPAALVLAAYTVVTALIGHHFWTMDGIDRYANSINFYKNVSIVGGLLLLYVTGAGRYSLDAKVRPAVTASTSI